MANTDYHFGQMLADKLSAMRYPKAALERRAGLAKGSITQIVKIKNTRLDTIFALSNGLKYNFLKDLAALLPAEYPSATADPELGLQQARIAELEKKLELLEAEKNLLKELLAGKT